MMGLAPQNGIITILAIGGFFVFAFLGFGAAIVEIARAIAWIFS